MKKWKVIFISIAIVVGIGGAFASYNQEGICSYYNQFRYTGGTYVDVGEQGVDYDCAGGAGICTYYKPYPSSPWIPCHYGVYTLIDNSELKANKK